MAVSPFKTFSAGEVLTASDLNASFSQVFDNGEDLAYPATQARDFNGVELILDADGDSSITSDTDDQVDFKLASTDYIIFKAGATTNVVDINGSVTTTGTALDLSNLDALTTGKGLHIVSNSADTGTREIVTIHNDNTLATNTTCLELIQDAANTAFLLDNNADSTSISIDSEATSANIVNILADTLTTGTAININNVDAITTGTVLNIVSNSTDTSLRNLVNITNDNAAASSTRCLRLQTDADGASGVDSCFLIVNNANAISSLVLADSTTTFNVFDVSADALTTGKILNLVSNSSSTSTRELVTIHNDNSAATGTACLELIQDASFRALYIDANGTAAAVDMDCAGLGINIDTTGSAAGIIDMTAGNGSYTGNEVTINCARSASVTYSFLVAVSASETTPDTEFDFRGDGNGFADGSFTGGGADFAEFYEWLDGNPEGEDRRGIAVALEGKYIREAKFDDPPSKIIGVISANPTVVGDSAWNCWRGKYLRDDFGSYIFEDYEVWSWEETFDDKRPPKNHCYASDNIPDDVKVPDNKTVTIQKRRKLNPDFDPTMAYDPRSERKEWDWVGRIGKLRIRKGQVTRPDWVWMQDVSDSVEQWTL